jgi:hypothetical protein
LDVPDKKRGQKTMAAHIYRLSGPGVEIEYTIGGDPSLPVLTYRAGAFVKNFAANEVLTDRSALGRLVSVPLLRTIDVGGERFGVFLPAIEGRGVTFTTTGIYETYPGPESKPAGTTVWRGVPLTGVAETEPG